MSTVFLLISVNLFQALTKVIEEVEIKRIPFTSSLRDENIPLILESWNLEILESWSARQAEDGVSRPYGAYRLVTPFPSQDCHPGLLSEIPTGCHLQFTSSPNFQIQHSSLITHHSSLFHYLCASNH
jgi:hypothetical protein